MSNKLTQFVDPSLQNVWQKAEKMVADEFDHGDGERDARKVAIAANLLSLSKAEVKGVSPDSMWNKMDQNKQDKFLDQIAGMDKEVADADDAVASIWDKMNPNQKENYLAWHPKSKFHAEQKRHNSFTMRDNPNDPKDPKKSSDEGKKGLKQKQKKDSEDAEPVAAEGEEEKESDQPDSEDKPEDKSEEGSKKKRAAGNGDWWDSLSIERQAAYLKKHPNSKKARRHRGIVRNLVSAALGKIHEHTQKLGHEFKDGMSGLRQFREGRPMTEEQKHGLSKTAKIVGGLVIGALAGLALFTPLGPYAMDLGSMYLDHLMSKGESESESGTNLHMHMKKEKQAMDREDEHDLHHMTMDMTNWLLQQDPIQLAKQLKENAEKA